MESLHSWWEVPCIAYFCSLFKTAFRLFEFAIEDLELGFILDGTSNDTCLIRDLIICLLRGCYQTKDVTFINWELYLYDILQKVWVKEENRSNPLSHQSAFCILPLRTKVEILHSLCEYRLDIVDVADVMKVVDSRRLRVQPLGRDQKGNVYWYFYGLRLYREECLIPPENLKKKWDEEWKQECEKYFRTNGTTKPIKKRKRGRPKKVHSDGIYLESDGEEKNRNKEIEDHKRQPRWTVVCNTLEDWYKLAEKFHKSKSSWEKKLYKVLSEDFLDALTALVAENERNSNLSLLEQLNQHNESIRIELQEGGGEDHPANLARKRRQKQDEQISDQHDVRKETRASKARAYQTKQEEEKHIASSHDDITADQTQRQLGSEEDYFMFSRNQELYQDLYKVLNYVKSLKDSWPFLEPVDESYAPGYYNIVKDPIDLSIIEEKVQQKAYSCWKEMQRDIKKMVQNCNLYNGSHSEYAFMAQTIWRNFQKQIKKIFIDTTYNSVSKKRVRFLLPGDNIDLSLEKGEQPSNEDREQDNNIADKDCSVNERDGDSTVNKNCTVAKVEIKVSKRKRRKRRPPGMRAIEMLAEAAEKALKDVEASNLRESSASNEENLLPTVGTAFPNLKVSTIQSHPASLRAKCMATKDKTMDENINQLLSKNTNSSDFVQLACDDINSLDLAQCNDLVIESESDQVIVDSESSADCFIAQSCNMHATIQDLAENMDKDNAVLNVYNSSKELNNENKKDNNRHNPLILYLSSDNKSSQNTKAKENITHHNYALIERTESLRSQHTSELQNVQNLEMSLNANIIMPPIHSVASTNKTVENTVSKPLDMNESSQNCLPSVSISKSTPFFTASQESTGIQQSVDATVLNSSPVLDSTDHAIRLITEEETSNETNTNEPSPPDTVVQPSVTSQLCFQPLNQFSSNNKLLQNELPLNNRLPSFNQFLTSGQYSLNEHSISPTVPQQMILAQFPNLISHSGFPDTERRKMSSTVDQFIPSQQYICHPPSTLPISHPYQTLSLANNTQDRELSPLTQSMNLVLLPASSTEQSVSSQNEILNANKISVSKETPKSIQNTFQQKLPSAVPNYVIDATNQNERLMSSVSGDIYSQNYLTPGCIFSNSSYPTFTTADSSICFSDRSLGIPVTSDTAKDWNTLFHNNYTSANNTMPFSNHIHSRPTILKQPPIILQKPRIATKKPANHSSKLSNEKQSSENAKNILNQTLAPKLVATTASTITPLPQTVDTNKVGGEKIDLIIPPSLPFHYPSTTQANSQYLLENLEPTLTVNVPGSPPQFFPYLPERLVTSQNMNAFYPSHLISSVGMPPLMTNQGASFFPPSINTTRNQQDGISSVLASSGKHIGNISPVFASSIKQVGNIDNLKSTRPTSFQLPGVI